MVDINHVICQSLKLTIVCEIDDLNEQTKIVLYSNAQPLQPITKCEGRSKDHFVFVFLSVLIEKKSLNSPKHLFYILDTSVKFGLHTLIS